MSFTIVNTIGHTFRSGVHLRQVAAVVSGDVLRRYVEEPWNTPGGATAIPDGFVCKEHTHASAFAPFLPGLLAGASDPWTLNIGDTLTVSIDGAPDQTATLLGGDAAVFAAVTAAELVAVFNRDFTGAHGRYHPHLGFNHLFLLADQAGGTIQVTGGTMNSTLLFPTHLAYGDPNNSEQGIFHDAAYDGLQYLVDIVDPNQTHEDLAPTLRSWDAALNP